MGLGFAVGFGLVFCVAFGCFAFGVGFVPLRPVSLVAFVLNFGPRLVLVVPRGVGFSLSRFASVLVVCGGFVLFFPLFGAWCWSTQATK